MADAITAAVTVKTSTLKERAEKKAATLQAEFDKAQGEFDDATSKVEKAIEAWAKKNAKTIGEQVAKEARACGYRDGKPFSVTVTAENSPEIDVVIPTAPSRTQLDVVLNDVELLGLIEEDVLCVQPGSGNFGKYIVREA